MRNLLFIMIISLTNSSAFAENNNVNYLYEAFISAKSGLNLRTEPSLKSNKLLLIQFGERCDIIKFSSNKDTIDGILGKWVQISYKNNIGWVFSSYLSNQNLNKNTRKFKFSSFPNESAYIMNTNGALFFVNNFCEEGKDYKDIDYHQFHKYQYEKIPYQTKLDIIQYAFIDLGVHYHSFNFAKVNYSNHTGWVETVDLSKYPSIDSFDKNTPIQQIISSIRYDLRYSCIPNFKCKLNLLGFLEKQKENNMFTIDTGNSDSITVYNVEYSNDEIIIYYDYYYHGENKFCELFQLKTKLTKYDILNFTKLKSNSTSKIYAEQL